MSAPSATDWGSVVNSYGKIGIYTSVSSSNTTSTVTVQVWFWSKYSISDSYNTVYYNNNATTATTSVDSNLSISHTVATGDGWSTSNQTCIYETTHSVTRSTSAQTISCAAKFSNIDRVGGTMSASTTYTVPKLATYTISYSANGGSGAPSSQTKYYGISITLSTTTPTKTGYSFSKWNTSSSGSGTSYSSGATYSTNAALALYAIYTANTYTVSYNANGGSGAPSSQTKTYGVSLTLSTTVPTLTNYTFTGWATSSTGSVVYASGGTYTANASVTLYAVWELAYTLPVISNLEVIRCDSSGNIDETDGKYVLISFDWSVDTTDSSNYLSKIYLFRYAAGASSYSASSSYSYTATSGSFYKVWGSGAFSTEASYDVKIKATDYLGGSTSVTVAVPSANYTLDLYPSESGGIAFGCVAEEGKLISNYPATFNDSLIVDDTDISEFASTMPKSLGKVTTSADISFSASTYGYGTATATIPEDCTYFISLRSNGPYVPAVNYVVSSFTDGTLTLTLWGYNAYSSAYSCKIYADILYWT